MNYAWKLFQVDYRVDCRFITVTNDVVKSLKY